MKRYLLLFLLTSRTATGQTPDSTATLAIPPKSNYKFGVLYEVGLSTTVTRTPNIRSFFRENQIKRDTPLDQFVYTSFGGRYRRFKFLFQNGIGASQSTQRSDDGPVARQLFAIYRGGMLGYDVLDSRNRRLYVNAGYGETQYEYSVYNRSNQTVAYPNLAQYSQSGNIPLLELRSNYLDFSLEYTQREKRKQSAETVLRVGYRQGLRGKAWRSDAFQLTDAPKENISQIYLQLGLYFSVNRANSTN